MTTPDKSKIKARPLPQSKEELEQRLARAHDFVKGAEATPSTGKPWENAHPRVKVGYALRMSEELHMKVQYITDKMPKTSMHQFIIEAIDERVERVLREMEK